MTSIVRIYCTNIKELSSFLELFFLKKILLNPNESYWEKNYKNPVEMSDIVASFIDNKNRYQNCNMWVSIDKGAFINITDNNYNYFIKYLFERYPY